MLNRNEKLLVLINAIYFIAATMSAVFVNVYLYTFTGSIYSMTTYAIVRFTMIPLGFYIAGIVSRRWSLSSILTTGLMIITISLGFLLMFNHLFGENILLIYMVGLILGTGEGLYWFAISKLNLQVSIRESRAKFISMMGIFNSASTIVAPFVATMIVRLSETDTEGYLRIFWIVIVLQILAAFVSTRVENFFETKAYTVWDKLNLKADGQWRYLMISHFIFGIRDSMLIVMTGILIFNATGGRGSLYGDLLTGFAVLNLIANTVASRVIQRNNRIHVYYYGALLLFTSTMMLVLVPNLIGAVYFGLVNALAIPFVSNTFNIIMMNAMQDYAEYENITGRVIAREFALNGGRLLGMAMTIALSFILPESYSLIAAVTFCSAAIVVLVLYAKKYHTKRDALKQI